MHRQTEEKIVCNVLSKSQVYSVIIKCLAIVNKKTTCGNRQNNIRYCTDTVLDLIVCTFLLPRAAS